jgi:hypothetical protein
MMVPKKSLILAGVALAFVGATAGAQNQSGKVFARYNKPLRTASLDLATGTVTRGPAVQQKAGTTVSDFPNVDLGGFIGADTGGGFCEWFDAGTKGFNGNASDLMNNFVFAYCCATLAVESGGVGGTTNLGFYEGYVTGGGTSTTAVAVFTLSGLPANTANSSPFIPGGGTACYLINITFAALVPFADGPIGYSHHFLDLDVTGVAGSTIPFMACVSSCSGTGPDGLGMVDVIDEYCPPGFLLSTFTFGTTQFGSYFSSMSMDIRELGDCTATVTVYNSTSPACVDVLSSSPMVIGTTWIAEVTHAPGTAGTSTLLIRGSKIAGNGANGGTSGGESRGRLLVTGAFVANLSSTTDTLAPILATQRSFAAPIPLQFGLACNEWFGQCLTLGAGKQKLSNGLEIDTGL